MKKLALLTAVSAIALTAAAPAFAKGGYTTSTTTKTEAISPGHSYTVVERDLPGDQVVETRTTTREFMTYKKPANGEVPDFTGTWLLEDGRQLIVKGETAYLANANGGWKYYAPKGAYVTRDGATFYTEDGQVLRLEGPPEVVYVDANKMDNNSNKRVYR